jgi:hypothetical protein
MGFGPSELEVLGKIPNDSLIAGFPSSGQICPLPLPDSRSNP